MVWDWNGSNCRPSLTPLNFGLYTCLLAVPIVFQLKEAYEQMQVQPASGSQGMSDESGTDNDSKVCLTKRAMLLQ